MRKKFWSKLAAFGLSASLVLSGCSNTGSDTSSTGGTESKADTQNFAVALASDVTNYDPIQNNNTMSSLVINSMYDSLLSLDENSELQPNLASSWKAPDNKTYVYEIRDDVTFWDGNKMTADDVVYSLNRNLDKDSGSLYGTYFESVKSIKKTGDWEVTIKMKEPDASFQYMAATIAFDVIEKSYAEEKGKDFGKSSVGTMGTGPYKFKSATEGSQIDLERNDSYWNKDNRAMTFETIEYDIIEEETARVMALNSGQVDWIYSPTTESREQLESKGVAEFVYQDGIDNLAIYFNCSKGPFADVNVRKAVACAMDAHSMEEAAYGEGAFEDAKALPFDAKTMNYEPDTWVTANDTLDSYAYSIDKAKEYLAKSDYPDGFECTMPVTEVNQKECEALQYYVKELGIDLKLETVKVTDLLNAVYGMDRDKDGNRSYDLICFSWVADFADPVSYMTLFYGENECEGGSNMSAYKNAEFDKLYVQQKKQSGAKRSETMMKAYELLVDDCPAKTLSYSGLGYAINKKYELKTVPMWFWNISFADVTVK